MLKINDMADGDLIGVIWYFVSMPYVEGFEIGFNIFNSSKREKGFATEALNKIFSILAIVSISISAIIFITYLFSKLFSAKLSIISNFNKLIYDNSVVFSWALATLATFGSLFYSEVSGFIPCTFCWYERIAMYPLVLILGIGILKKNHEVWIYAFPFSFNGISI